ncbi:MAG: HAD family hydrolase [Candidatus Nephthysia bennettiae]|uniref:HAD family hydrolase n=1 Tax=Candidatus Nephthysia bennettiae TaxID=3127016 RepID=A0A934K852_9BACT|nr:HAD family hydrolase [Candidatus Dormibacteraeota bacterium]MBJ7613188.1 HAD family hydrolase [Candidatus Dormibacteraeota bacterium]PZR99059.1 MAG: HAD family hydrolase [Candidatus Dormibacteraeota bacterium]
MVTRPALLFDLDGTLVDSVYQHVLAWREALERCGVRLAVWKIHRHIGMSGGLLVNALLRETRVELSHDQIIELQRIHRQLYLELQGTVRALPGAVELLRHLSSVGIAWAIGTSGTRATASHALGLLELPPDVPVVTRDEVPYAKPDPHLFLAAAGHLGVDIQNAIVVGDSVWDMLAAQRARALGVGVLSGGYGREELERAGAFRVYDDPAGLLTHLDELGIRSAPGG